MEENIPEFTDEEVEKILRDALKLNIEEKRKYPNKVQLNKALISVVGEFLSSYRIIGYDYEGQHINLTCHKTPLDKAALDNAFIEEFSKFMSRRGH